jgi:hypothetical protein
VFFVAVMVQAPMTFFSMSEGDSFRFSQNVMQIREFKENGINLNGNLPLFGENSHVLFEFPLYQIIASLLSEFFRLDPVVGARVTALVFFQVSAILLVILNRAFFEKKNELILLVLYQFLPFGLFYGHAPLGEFLPVSLMYLAALMSNGESKRRKALNLIFSLILVSFAFLTKVTTAVALTPLLLLSMVNPRPGGRKFMAFKAGASVASGLIATLAWNEHADKMKELNSYTEALTSTNPRMIAWNFGTFSQRLDFENWYHILIINMGPIVLNGFILIVLASWVVSYSRNVKLGILLLCIPSSILIFTNLYIAHTYYLCAIYGVLILILNPIIGEATNKFDLGRGIPLLVTAILIGAYSSTNGSNSMQTILNHQGPPKEAKQIRDVTRPGEWVLYLGCDWSPYIPYYTERKAIMVPNWIESPRKSDFQNASTVYICDTNPTEKQRNLSLLDKSWKKIDDNVFVKVNKAN